MQNQGAAYIIKRTILHLLKVLAQVQLAQQGILKRVGFTSITITVHMLKLLENSILILVVIIISGCKSKEVLNSASKEREDYRKCTPQKVEPILEDYKGDWKVTRIDSTKKFNLLYLYSKEKNKKVVGVSNRVTCEGNKMKIGKEYYFMFSCHISSLGNHSLYIFKPDKMFLGHEISYKVPLGDQKEFVGISTQEEVLVLKLVNVEGLCGPQPYD